MMDLSNLSRKKIPETKLIEKNWRNTWNMKNAFFFNRKLKFMPIQKSEVLIIFAS